MFLILTVFYAILLLLSNQVSSELFRFRYYLGHGLAMSIVGRSERSDLRPSNLNFIGHVGGRYARSDLQYSLFTITDVIKNA